MTLHALRHTAATLMVAARVPILDVARILRHTSLTVTMRYAHALPESREAAIRRLGRALDGFADDGETDAAAASS